MKKALIFFFGVNILLLSNKTTAQIAPNDTLPTAVYGPQKDYEIGGVNVTDISSAVMKKRAQSLF